MFSGFILCLKILSNWRFFWIGLTFYIVAQPVSAQAFSSTFPSDTLISPRMSEVVVSATRFSSRIKNTPEAVSVLNTSSSDELQLRSAPEALKIVPGVFVQKTNHGGGSAFVRGLTGNQTLLLIDGIRLSNSTMRYGPNQYFNTIDIFSVEKTEVLRGNGSVQYGSDAIGGTIQTFTHDLETSTDPEMRTEFLSRFATHGMEKSINLNSGFSNKFSALRAGITYRDFGDVVGGDTTGRQTPTGYRELDFDFKGRLRISSNLTITLVFQNVHQTGIPVFHKVALENYLVYKTDPQNRQLAYIRLNRELDRGILKSAAITGSYQHAEEGRLMRKNGSETSREESDKVRTYGFTGELLFSEGRKWNGNLGIEVYSDLVNSTRTDSDIPTGDVVSKRGLYPDGSTMTSAAIFSVNTIDLDKWSFTAGTRFNTYVIHVKDEVTGRTTLNPSAVVGNIGILRKITGSSRIFLSLNTGFRAPNIDDLGTLGIVDFRYETPNLELKPERSLQYQLGYRFYGQKFKGDIFVYRNELYNLITRRRIEGQLIDGYPLYQKENSDRAYIQGVETSLDLPIKRYLNINGSMTYTFGQNITNKEPMRRIPPLYGRLSADYRFEALRFGIEWLAAAKQTRLAQGDIDDNRIPAGGTPGWNIFNINSGYTWKFLTFDFCISNIFNIDYRYHGSGINGYGRSAFLTIRVRI